MGKLRKATKTAKRTVRQKKTKRATARKIDRTLEELRWKPKAERDELKIQPRVVAVQTTACLAPVSPMQILLDAHMGVMRSFFQAIEIMFGIKK